ncbi:MAG: hypothetical protein QGG88_10550 [Gammaproteobacteria bacterium]|jgi:hypothetical protein|nr:hypothetical protein [Gammaproteobacteria bacterium]
MTLNLPVPEHYCAQCQRYFLHQLASIPQYLIEALLSKVAYLKPSLTVPLTREHKKGLQPKKYTDV